MCIRLLDHLMRRPEVDAIIIISVIKYKTLNTNKLLGVYGFLGAFGFPFTLDTLRNLQESKELKQV